ncbi:FAD binding domain-containing protein [uncultured Tateyamaria sp.]|uniref:FAD binding domain-containing protein n=1 Tax=uncultured Tateyamaria sp. TaxID=455651 RepID=UPI002623A7F6|nr:FAD binding domain-containing protein [uncultured Tateyamaria sp.]
MTTVQTFASLAEASAAQGAIMGGGTLLMRQVNEAPHTVPGLIRITDPGLSRVSASGDRIEIGAGVTMRQVMDHPDLAAFAPVARAIGGPALRNMATVGGNLFAPHPYGDFTVGLLAAGAQVVWADGRREELEDFLRGRVSAQGILATVSVVRTRPEQLRFRKVSRTRPKGVSVMSIAARLDGTGSSASSARIAFGAMGPTPLRARAAEVALQGVRLDTDGVGPACAACLEDLSPADDALASAWYRAQVAPIYLRRCLLGES